MTLAGCSSEPEDLFTAEQARSIGIVDEPAILALDKQTGDSVSVSFDDSASYPESGTAAGDYLASLPSPDGLDPASCSDSLYYLVMRSKDGESTDKIFQFGNILLYSDDVTSNVTQMLRLFPDVDAAKTFMTSYRDAYSSCSELRVAGDGGPIVITRSTGGLPFDGEGFEVTQAIKYPTADPVNDEMYVIRQGNLIALVGGGAPDGETLPFEAVAQAISDRMDGKFSAAEGDSSGAQKANQSIAEACGKFEALSGPFTSQRLSDIAYNRSDETFADLSMEWASVSRGVTNPDVKAAADSVGDALRQVEKSDDPVTDVSLVSSALDDLTRVAPDCYMLAQGGSSSE